MAAIKPIEASGYWFCGYCGESFVYSAITNYCHHCGVEIDWTGIAGE